MKSLLVALCLAAFAAVTFAGTCPDGTSCGGTCCQLESGAYGCCPYNQATCCSDKQHCCPGGYTCDLSKGQCTKAPSTLMATRPAVAVQDAPAAPQTTCSDGTSCSGTETCCQLASGSFGCCPYANATCCSDHEHCCPHGYTCDLKDGECKQSAAASAGDAMLPLKRRNL